MQAHIYALLLIPGFAFGQESMRCQAAASIVHPGTWNTFFNPNINRTCQHARINLVEPVSKSLNSVHEFDLDAGSSVPCMDPPLVNLTLPVDYPRGLAKINWICDDGPFQEICQEIRIEDMTSSLSSPATTYALRQECQARRSGVPNSLPPVTPVAPTGMSRSIDASVKGTGSIENSATQSGVAGPASQSGADASSFNGQSQAAHTGATGTGDTKPGPTDVVGTDGATPVGSRSMTLTASGTLTMPVPSQSSELGDHAANGSNHATQVTSSAHVNSPTQDAVGTKAADAVTSMMPSPPVGGGERSHSHSDGPCTCQQM